MLQDAVREAILEHRRAGRTIVVWRDGRVVERRGEEFDRALEGKTSAESGC